MLFVVDVDGTPSKAKHVRLLRNLPKGQEFVNTTRTTVPVPARARALAVAPAAAGKGTQTKGGAHGPALHDGNAPEVYPPVNMR